MTEKDKPFGGKLENWFHTGTVIIGNLFDDPRSRWEEGTPIHTSRVVREYEDAGRAHVETLNTIYELGKPKAP